MKIPLPDVGAIQTRQANLEGTCEFALRRLVKEALRIRPDRIIVGEVRQEECLDLLISLNSGLPEFTPATATRRHAGEDVSVFCNVHGEQRRNVISSTGADGRPVLTVTVGSVAVHTTTALRSFLAAWRKAATVTGMLEGARNDA